MWLVGMMGSGKSSAGALAAERVGADFYDTDEIIVGQVGCSIPQFWEEHGEPAFREEEKLLLVLPATVPGHPEAGHGLA